MSARALPARVRAAPVVSDAPVASPSRAARPQSSARDRRIAELGVLATVLVWSANFVVVKATLATLGPLGFSGTRYVVASATLFALLRWRNGRVRPPAGLALPLLGLGVLGFGAYQVVWTIGLTRIGAGDSALIVATSPVMVAVLAGAVGMDRLSAPKLIGALIAFGGVALVVAAGTGLALDASLVGDGLTLLASAMWAVYTIGGARILRHVDPLAATAWTVLGGTLVLVPLGIVEIAANPPPMPSPAVVAAILYSGALAAGVSNVLVFNAIRHVGPTRVTATQFLVPAGAVAFGALFLGEPVGLAQIVGGAVIVAGVWLTRRATLVPGAVRTRLSSGA